MEIENRNQYLNLRPGMTRYRIYVPEPGQKH